MLPNAGSAAFVLVAETPEEYENPRVAGRLNANACYMLELRPGELAASRFFPTSVATSADRLQTACARAFNMTTKVSRVCAVGASWHSLGHGADWRTPSVLSEPPRLRSPVDTEYELVCSRLSIFGRRNDCLTELR